MKNHPDYQGNSEIPLAGGVDLKTSKQAKSKTKTKTKNHLPLKQRIQHKVCADFLPTQRARECLCSRILVILDSSPGDKLGIYGQPAAQSCQPRCEKDQAPLREVTQRIPLTPLTS